MKTILLFTFTTCFSLFAQDYPPPCSANSPTYTDTQPASPNCQPCYVHSIYTYDLNWDVVCNESCADLNTAGRCSAGRTDVSSTVVSCRYDVNVCPGSANWAITIQDITYDTCDGTTCNTGFTVQCGFACSGGASLTPPQKQLNANACNFKQPRLDRFGPPVDQPRPLAIPAGLLLHRRYEVLLAQARPGTKCIRTKHYLKNRKKGVKV